MRLRRKGGADAVRLVLVATDRSETAERAVGFAAEMAQRYEADSVSASLAPEPHQNLLPSACGSSLRDRIPSLR